MTDECWEFWIALWRVSPVPERRILVVRARQAELLWECVCRPTIEATDLHDWSASHCWRCQRARR